MADPELESLFQSTLPGWGATLEDLGYPISDEISIHAPRMGSDGTACCRVSADCNFNPRSPDGERLDQTLHKTIFFPISIHAPRMGSDADTCRLLSVLGIFQSTLPGWGATRRWFAASRQVDISIHAPRMGSDQSIVNQSI